MGDDRIDMVILEIDMGYFVTFLRASALLRLGHNSR